MPKVLKEFIVSNLDKYDLCDESLAMTYWKCNRRNLVCGIFDLGFQDVWFGTDYVREICAMIFSEEKMMEEAKHARSIL
jgi:hypothetical protein